MDAAELFVTPLDRRSQLPPLHMSTKSSESAANDPLTSPQRSTSSDGLLSPLTNSVVSCHSSEPSDDDQGSNEPAPPRPSQVACVPRRPSLRAMCISCPESKKRVSFIPDEAIAQVIEEELWSDELQQEREAGRCWREAATDRLRFKRRIECASSIITPVLTKLLTKHRTAAATLIQSHVRGWLFRRHFSLRALNASGIFQEPEPITAPDTGLDYAVWQGSHQVHTPPDSESTRAHHASHHRQRAGRSLSTSDVPEHHTPQHSPKSSRKHTGNK